MNLSGISSRSWPGRLLRSPLRLIPPGTRIPILHGPLRGKRWIVGSGTHGCWLGTYEHDKQRLFARMVRPGDVVFDVGANVGYYSLLAATLVGVEGRIVAFEPVPRNVHYLREHLRLNSILNVEVMQTAVADQSGSLTFDEGLDSFTGHLSPTGRLKVRVASLDELFEAGLPPPTLVKMDIEGGELDALRGARRMLAETHPRIFLATHGPDQHHACCDLLRELGFDLRSLDGRSLEQTDEILALPPHVSP